MPTKEIKDFPAVVTPAVADLLVTQQDADSKTRKMTVSQAVKAENPKAHAALHQNGGADEISVLDLSGLLADAQTALAHEASHISGGGDPFTSTQLLEAIVKRLRESGGTVLLLGAIADGDPLVREGTAVLGGGVRKIRETGGPTVLTLGAIPDGQTLKRSGATLVGGGALPVPDFTSSQQTVAADTQLDVAHSLGAAPSLVRVTLVCTTDDLGYVASTADAIEWSAMSIAGDLGAIVYSDATNVSIVQGVNIQIIDASTKNAANITLPSWRWVIRAWA